MDNESYVSDSPADGNANNLSDHPQLEDAVISHTEIDAVPELPANSNSARSSVRNRSNSNLTAAGDGKITAAVDGKITAAGDGKITAAGGGKITAAGDGKIIAAGDGKIIAADDVGDAGVTDLGLEDYSLLTFIPNYQQYKKRYAAWKQTRWPGILMAFVLWGLYSAYLIAVVTVHSALEETNYWCDGDGLLLVMTLTTAVMLVYYYVIKHFFGKKIYKSVMKPIGALWHKMFAKMWFRLGFFLLLIVALVTFLAIDTKDNRERLQSISGIFVLLFLGFIFSAAPRKVVWRHIFWGISLQFILGLLILRWPTGQNIFSCLAGKVETFLAFTNEGSYFVFNYLAVPDQIFAFYVLPVTLFFSFFVSLLYYYGIMQWVVIKVGWLLQVTIGTTACESVNAAANIFLGMTEAPLVIKPFIPNMTKSELHAVLTGGFATIAGSTMAAYISFGISASNLLSASIMNAPAALAFSKLFYPETEKSVTTVKSINIPKSTEVNALHAALEGVTAALPLVANIAGNLIAFVAFIAFFNSVFNWSCMLVNVEDGFCTLENVTGYVFMPLAWTMGVPWNECHTVGALIALKTIVNEFVAYTELADLIAAGEISKRAEIIATYALCGFSNISSIGIQMGGIGMLAPTRRSDAASVVVRAMVAGSAACFLSGCVAGLLLDEDSFESSVTRMVLRRHPQELLI